MYIYIYLFIYECAGLRSIGSPAPPLYSPHGTGLEWFLMAFSFRGVILWCACWWSISLAGRIQLLGKLCEVRRKP